MKILNKIKQFRNQVLNSPIIRCSDKTIGKFVTIEPNVTIQCKKLVLGDGVVIKSGTRIEMDELIIGDYTVINNNCYLSGTNRCEIGHNCWFGHYSIIDSIGTTKIGNGVGVGAHSQLWSHIYFGDLLEGCRFGSEKPLIIDDDVWLTGHCIVSPIHARRRSMAMVGSIITKDMEENQIYAGFPAKNISEKIGNQFEEIDSKSKLEKMIRHLNDFTAIYPNAAKQIQIVDSFDKSDHSQFNVSKRTYIKRLTKVEHKFMKYLLPVKAKFIPDNQSDWVSKFYQLSNS